MNEDIVIYEVPDDPNNDRVRKRLGELRGVSVSEIVCPPSVRELYRMPFIRDENGGRHFGVEGIEGFVRRRLEAEAGS